MNIIGLPVFVKTADTSNAGAKFSKWRRLGKVKKKLEEFGTVASLIQQ